MARVYATMAEFRDWSGDQSAELTDQQRASASRLVEKATRGAVYDTDAQLYPLDLDVLAALRDATCAVLAARHPNSTSAAGVAAELKAAGLKSAKLGTADYELAEDSSESAGISDDQLPYEAHSILEEAGLVGGPVWVVG